MRLTERRVALCVWTAAIAIAPGRSVAGEPVVAEITAVRDAEPPRPQLRAVRTSIAPDIDGDLRDPAWDQATMTTAFTQKFPDEARPPSEPTELRVLYDDRALYIAFNCVQLASPVMGRLARRDRQVEADWVQVAIGDGSNAYEFSVNAAGVLSDGVRFNDTEYSGDWDGVWEAEVARHDRGWSAEIRIPLRIFRHTIGAPQWRFQARRYISQRQETDEWAYIPRSTAGEVSHYGWLSGMVDVRRTNPLELLPYASTGANWMDTNRGDRGLGYRATAGVDLAWRIGKDLTLDATINPDFAQVEADQVVLNLTTFETFVPEKRPFFLNGMAMFQMPRMELFPSTQTLFYTRRIGSVPDVPALPPALSTDAGAAVAAPEPSTIYGAAKLSGQLASGVTAGFVSALTGRNDVDVTATSPARPSRLLAEPMALANVARIKVEAGGGATFGVLATALRRFESEPDYPQLTRPDGSPAQQCPDGSQTAAGARCFHDAYVAGLDGLWRSRSGTYVASAQAIVTSIQNGPPRTMLDGTTIKSGDTASSGRFYLAKEGGQWLGSLEAQMIGRRVDYNDLGYLQRQNLVRVLPYLAYRTLEPFWAIAETETHVYMQLRENLDGVTLLRGYYGGGRIRFKNFWTLESDVFRYDRRNEDREVGDGTTLERPTGYGLDLSLSTDPRRQLSAALGTETLVYTTGSHGHSFMLFGEVTYQPLTRFELQLLPQLTLSSGVPRFVPGPRDPGVPPLLFADLEARAAGGTLRTSYAFTNRLTLQLYGQLLLTSERYSRFRSYTGSTPHPVLAIADLMDYGLPLSSNPDQVQTDLNVSAVLRWEFRPGSTLFLVYSRSQSEHPELAPGQAAELDPGALRTGPAHDALRLKLSYYWN